MSAEDPTSLAHAEALAPIYYVDRRWSEVEQKQLFGNCWHFIAHRSEFPGSGDHIVAEIAGQPVVLVCQGGGEIRGFHNVCRHRAGPLALCNGKGAKRLRCQYHGWQYGLDGQLLAAPEMLEAKDFDKSQVRLPEIRIGVWQGLVFAALSPDAMPLDDLLAGIAERIAPYNMSELRFHGIQTYEVACNWKVYVDNYAEGYHLPYVHPALTQTVDYGNYESELGANWSLQVSPITQADGPYGSGTAYYYLVWPNLMLNIVPGRLQFNRVRPLAQDRCAVDFIWYYADDPTVTARIADDLAFTDQVQAEDAGICEHVQRGLTAGGYVPGRLSPKREAGVWHFHELLRGVYANGEGEG